MKKPCECCDEIIPEFQNLSTEEEEIVRQTYRETGPITAIYKLREFTNAGLKDAKLWVDHCGEFVHRKTIPCPYCSEPLRTHKAKQCRHCLRDWHDENELKWLK